MGFAGFDTSVYPGDDVMKGLKESTNLRWCGFYLAPSPSHPNKSWMDRHSALAEMGWGFAVVYVGQQESTGPGSHVLTTDQGKIDGADACTLAAQAGFARGTALFLDIEAGGAISASTAAYVRGWAPAVRDQGYVPAAYCSHTAVKSIEALGLEMRFWIFKLKTSDASGHKPAPYKEDDPASTGITSAIVWQWAQNVTIDSAKGKLNVDLDTGTTSNPSEIAAPKVAATT
ncbi:MAG TPA: glycoside hydrolase domain-containing protein [Myxococcales bacterium]|nr:glycoside hydrolase domain-containing protein [Myxococcales bacterium]